MSKKLNGYVHCHVCPLKDVCEFAEPNASYTYHKAQDNEFLACSVKCDVATRNCPLKKLVSF